MLSLREELLNLRQEFAKHSQKLYCAKFWSPLSKMTRESWARFTDQRKEPGTEWDLFPDDKQIARFTGDLQLYAPFQKVAQRAYHLFCHTDPTLNRAESYHGWLDLLWKISSFCATKGVATDDTLVWDREKYVIGNRMRNDIVSTSLAAIDLFLNPMSAHWESKMNQADLESYPKPSPWQLQAIMANPYILTLTPREIAASCLRETLREIDQLPLGNATPRFVEGDANSGQLIVGTRSVRSVRAGSINVCQFLRRFESQNWKQPLANPYIPSKGVVTDEVLKTGREFVRTMNKLQNGPTRVRFSQTGSGRFIRWRIYDATDDLLCREVALAQ